MPLNVPQVRELDDAIRAYAFPSVYFDFARGCEVKAPGMSAVEVEIRNLLVSTAPDRIRDGLANVIYWGYAQIGYRSFRVRRFRDQVTADQLDRFQTLIASGQKRLADIGALGLPQFSGVSFVSKILTFIDPERYCVLDKQLLKLGTTSGHRALDTVSAGTQIRITVDNEKAYDGWRAECAAISARYFSGQHRVVEIERGFFQLVQTGRVTAAREMYAAA